MTNINNKKVFAVGDIHGHYPRLETLLKQEEIIIPSNNEDNTSYYNGFIRNPDKDLFVISLGDFIHVGNYPQRDYQTLVASSKWFDKLLWGNHDRAIIDPKHQFRGFEIPLRETVALIHNLVKAEKLELVFNANGILLSHAGLHQSYKYQKVEFDNNDVNSFVDFLNNEDKKFFASQTVDDNYKAIVNAISTSRGGQADAGGILWRDVTEKLYNGFPQVFGHSAHRQHVTREFKIKDDTDKEFYSYCIDIGGRNPFGDDNCLAGIYLPDLKVRSVHLGQS